MDKIADSLFILENDGSISGFVGKCSEYIELQKEEKKEAVLQQEQKSQEQKQLSQQSMQPQPAQKKKLSYKEQREFEELDKEIPVLEAEAKLLEEKIDYLEKRILILENVILKNKNNNKTNYPEEPTDMYMI